MKWIVEAESIDDIVLGRYMINDTPMIECKDCARNYSTTRLPQCDFMSAYIWPDSFCSYAERQEE